MCTGGKLENLPEGRGNTQQSGIIKNHAHA